MTQLKFRYVYGIPGKPETYFFRYFTIEEIEEPWRITTPIIAKGGNCEIISRDQFTNCHELFEGDIVQVDFDECGSEIPDNFKGTIKFIESGFFVVNDELELAFPIFQEIATWKVIGNIHGVKS